MKANASWIKMDYKVHTAIGYLMLFLTLSALLGGFLYTVGVEEGLNWAFLSICFALFLFMPLGAWQVLSGLKYTLDGDKLQQIYIAVVIAYFGIWYSILSFKSVNLLYVMMVIALVIAVWKYTVVRADYISLKIIDVPKTDSDSLLDA